MDSVSFRNLVAFARLYPQAPIPGKQTMGTRVLKENTCNCFDDEQEVFDVVGSSEGKQKAYDETAVEVQSINENGVI